MLMAMPEGLMMQQASKAIPKEPQSSSKVSAQPTASRAQRRFLTSCEIDGEVFRVGDSAYALEEGQTYKVRPSAHSQKLYSDHKSVT